MIHLDKFAFWDIAFDFFVFQHCKVLYSSLYVAIISLHCALGSMCSCVGALKPVYICNGLLSLLYYIVTFSENVNCIVCLRVAFVCLLRELCALLNYPELH